MINEALLIGALVVEFLLIVAAIRYGTTALTLSLAINMVLVGTFAPKLIETFGLISNVGNIFYGVSFVITNLLVELYGKVRALETIWAVFFASVLFITMTQFVIRFSAEFQSVEVSSAIDTLFVSSPRIAIASMVAFIASQYVCIYLYSYLKENMRASGLWYRHAASLSVAQLVDSMLFFSIAFALSLSNSILIEIALTGLLLKVVIGIIGTPVLYVGQQLENSK